jgi:hypothetical protein
MATRIQNKILLVSQGKQTNIKTAQLTNMLRFRQLNAELAPSGFLTENDAAEVGKGNEFIQGVYPVSFNPLGRIEKYASAEFMTWAWIFAMGKSTFATGVYSITPIDVCIDGMELPYFTLVEQVCEGGGAALDNAYIGCAIEDVEYTFNYGPGRQSGRCVVNWVGSGIMATPSGVPTPIPTTTVENYLLSANMSMMINGVDYIQAATMLSGTIGWKNNLLVGPGFFPGSGVQNGAAVRGRLEIGPRAPTFTFTARLLKNSTEYQYLLNPLSAPGTATVTATFDATHGVTFNFPAIQYETVVNGEQDGIVSVTVTVAVKWSATAGFPMSVDASCGLTGVGQSLPGPTQEANGKNGKNGKPATPPPPPPPSTPPAQPAAA